MSLHKASESPTNIGILSADQMDVVQYSYTSRCLFALCTEMVHLERNQQVLRVQNPEVWIGAQARYKSSSPRLSAHEGVLGA